MTFNINRFSAEVNNSGLAIGGHFEVRVTRPRGLTLQGPFNNIVESVGLAARIDSIDLPGRTIATIDNYYDVGIRRDIPYGAIYPDISFSIICSEDFREKEFFEKWQDLMVGNHRNNNTDGKHYNVGYYDDYKSTVEIVRYRPQGQPTYEIKLNEAYPKIVNPTSMNWSDTDAMKLTVSLSYRYFTIEQATNNKRDIIGQNPDGSIIKSNDLPASF